MSKFLTDTLAKCHKIFIASAKNYFFFLTCSLGTKSFKHSGFVIGPDKGFKRSMQQKHHSLNPNVFLGTQTCGLAWTTPRISSTSSTSQSGYHHCNKTTQAQKLSFIIWKLTIPFFILRFFQISYYLVSSFVIVLILVAATFHDCDCKV